MWGRVRARESEAVAGLRAEYLAVEQLNKVWDNSMGSTSSVGRFKRVPTARHKEKLHHFIPLVLINMVVPD